MSHLHKTTGRIELHAENKLKKKEFHLKVSFLHDSYNDHNIMIITTVNNSVLTSLHHCNISKHR
jgi:hypothetical protein